MNRHFVFKHYWWMGMLVGGGAGTFAYLLGGEDRVALVGAVIAGTLGFYYFVQQQKLSETELFHNLFNSFNSRYDQLRERLAKISSEAHIESDDDLNLIVYYFNLCAEEYVFYKEEYIPQEVWQAWCHGMLWYLRRHPFQKVWNEEVKKESFYGLTLDEIKRGACIEYERN